MTIAKELNMPVNILTTILYSMVGHPHRYWRIETKIDGVSRWKLMKSEGCVAVGWDKLSPLNDISYNKESKEKIRAAIETHYPDKPQQITGRQTPQLFNYVAVIAEGDIVLASDGVNILGIGKVIGGYSHIPGSDAPHRRQVDWLSFHEWSMPNPEGLQTTVTEVKKHENLITVEQVISHSYSPPLVTEPSKANKLPPLIGIYKRIQSILERKGQVILYGPSGTGKTFWAELVACELAARSHYEMEFAQLSDDQKKSIIGGDKDNQSLVRICCFHPTYRYEDFLEGYRPEEVNGAMVFRLHDGVFKEICEDAKLNKDLNFYLIIDEINRGDIPRIFGELLTVLERNKRNKSIMLPLSGKSFSVPENLFIIGTMNTADRSIALLDTALKRRFGFIELMPDSKVLENVVLDGIPLGPWLDALNRRICEHIGRNARNLQIGHSYLLDGTHPVSDFIKFSKVLREDIIPLLEDYCYEDYSILEKILKGLVDVNNQKIRNDLFDPLQKDRLIQSLLAQCPEITTKP
jgi:5-methylcytosine-specific restriction protein B